MNSPRIGLFGGTFDPVHHGHLIMARDVMESDNLQKIIFIPCACSPHKQDGPIASDEQRLAFLRLAVADEPGFEVSDWELRRGGVSYTIDTVLHFKSQMPGATFFWLVGEDQAAKLESWHRIEELRKLITFRFMQREGAEVRGSIGRRLDISSTEIRERLARGASARYLLPEPVRLEILRSGVYTKK
jgi:nicotinate-nucleotide adenylyltransferase